MRLNNFACLWAGSYLLKGCGLTMENILLPASTGSQVEWEGSWETWVLASHPDSVALGKVSDFSEPHLDQQSSWGEPYSACRREVMRPRK